MRCDRYSTSALGDERHSPACFAAGVWRELFPGPPPPVPDVRRIPPALLMGGKRLPDIDRAGRAGWKSGSHARPAPIEMIHRVLRDALATKKNARVRRTLRHSNSKASLPW